MLYRDDIVMVLLWKYFTILDGLDRGVEVILVDLAVNGSLSLFMTVLGHILIDNCWSDLLMNGGVVMTSLVPRNPWNSVSIYHVLVIATSSLRSEETFRQLSKYLVAKGCG